MYKQHILVIALGFTVGLTASACVSSVTNPKHCLNAGGDERCALLYEGKRPFCTEAACDASSEDFYGCVEEEPTEDCYHPCGAGGDDSCGVAEGENDGDGDGDVDDGDGDMGDGDGDGGMPCTGPADCAEAAPFCDMTNGVCVGCDDTENPDAACAELDTKLPVCWANTCVACTEDKAEVCAGPTPFCDAQSNTCVKCSDHDQCPDSACNLAMGNCFDPTAVLHVDGDGPDCNQANGTEAMPYCKLNDALFNAALESLIILHENDDQSSYAEVNEISKAIALFAAKDETPVLQGLGDPASAPISVTPSGFLFVRGVDFAGTQNDGLGLEINGGRAWVEQSEIVNNKGGGILVDAGGTLVLENSFVSGDITGSDPAIEVLDGEVFVVFSTLGAGAEVDSHAFVCAEGSTSTIRNSIVVSRGDEPEIDCPSVDLVNSLTEKDPGMNFGMDSNWFVDFNDGDFHLDPGEYPELIEAAALWQTGDPATDIDGAARPTDGSSDFAGADRLP